MEHDEAPKFSEEIPPELIERLNALRSSPYYLALQHLRSQVLGKRVCNSQAGRSGFILHFDDGAWVVTYLEGDKLMGSFGTGPIPPPLIFRIQNPEYGDGGPASQEDLPYRDEFNDMSRELARAHGQAINNLSIGEDCFNYCFPEDLELETHLVKDVGGMLGLRVFWEQW